MTEFFMHRLLILYNSIEWVHIAAHPHSLVDTEFKLLIQGCSTAHSPHRKKKLIFAAFIYY